MDTSTLYEKYDVFANFNIPLPEVPKYITSNLKHELRPYQTEAIRRWLHYIDEGSTIATKTFPIQLLYHMATGSGKTLIMAALMLDLYKRGYRDFIFFVNSRNIIEKTHDNFKNPGSSKYLFANDIIVDGKRVEIREVTSFSDSNQDAINIVFTTIQGLHEHLEKPAENNLSYSQFEGKKIVLIGDEAHHNNAKTMLSSQDVEDNKNWESTVEKIMGVSTDNILLEFTATIDMEDPNIFKKYKDRVIFRYDLKKFRLDGYSKDVFLYSVDSDIENRMLQAMIISQSRMKIASRNRIRLKPVIMFKSRTNEENKRHFEAFKTMVKNLSVKAIQDLEKNGPDRIKSALKSINMEPSILIEELKNDFMDERLMILDQNNIPADKQQKLNNLEDENNGIRAIFAVDMLNEGWDVLNLFDIVRLYDTRQSGHGKISKTTNQEAQLIGRGARYYPFVLDDESKRYVRKFDNDENAELRHIEELYYYSANDSRYIAEIKQALVTSGLMPETVTEKTLKLKPEFKKSKTYQDGVVFVNDRESLSSARMKQHTLFSGDFELPSLVEVDLPTGMSRVISAFDDQDVEEESEITEKVTFETEYGKIVPKNITRHAISLNKTFQFSNLEKKITALQSIDAFMDMMAKIKVMVSGVDVDAKTLNPEQKLIIAKRVLENIEEKIDNDDNTYIGTDFRPVKISEAFKDDIKRKYAINNGDQEFGIPQKEAKTSKYKLDLSTRDWYAYDENYGTSEEKSFVVMFNSIYNELEKNWKDIYLLRNEKAVTIYSFADGQPFEPDFILLTKDKKGTQSWQLFIEPKGGQLLAKDKPKQDFLEEITARNIAKVLADNSKMRIIGMPFYNEDTNRDDFIDMLKDFSKENKK